MNTETLTVYKANKLIEASYQAITLSEQLMLLACISKCDPDTLTADTAVTLTVSAFADLADIEATDAYDDMKGAAERLFGRYLVIDSPDPDNPRLSRTRTRWVHSIDYYDGEGTVCLYFSPKVLPYLTQLQGQFTKYKLQHVAQFRSKYGIRLYELLVQWQGRGNREIEIDWLREHWELTTKYKALKDLKARVIDPAVRDINEYSNLWVKYGQRKAGRRVIALQFQFGIKEQEPTDSASTQPHKLTRVYIEKHARPGETWEQAKARLRSTRRKPPPTK